MKRIYALLVLASGLLSANASNVLTADGVKLANSSIVTTKLIEGNAKTVNEVYLATIGKDVDDFTTTQTSDLFAIANQCPLVGGNAEFRARSLYALIDDDVEYDDANLCLQHGIIYKNLELNAVSKVSIQPNPTDDAATLLYSMAEDKNGTLVIYDALGKEVLRHGLSSEHERHAFSTAELTQGAYHYVVSSGADAIGTGKLMIVR